jgi:hypothetical protein
MPDWIDDYVRETAAIPSPEIYRLWTAITAVSGVLERKVWTNLAGGAIYPHVYTLLVGPPASGKTLAIRPVRDLWSHINGLNLSPDNVTKASLMDVLARSLRTVMNGHGLAYSFSAMNVAVSEFGVFLARHDTEFLSAINNIFDSPPIYTEERRSSGALEINKPHLVLLCGTQPDFLNSILPEEAWGMGFTSRLIMIYADSSMQKDLFSTVTVNSPLLQSELTKRFELKGEFSWSKNAIDEINAWNRAGLPPVPTHSKLQHYNGRRALHTVKLAMISAASRGAELRVLVEDFERAQSWLLEAEKTMPDIFRAMGAKSDSQVIVDMHYHLYMLWSRTKLSDRKPLSTQQMYEFLHSRVPSDKISRLIDVAEKTGYIRRGMYPDEWIPAVKLPTSSFGNE